MVFEIGYYEVWKGRSMVYIKYLLLITTCYFLVGCQSNSKPNVIATMQGVTEPKSTEIETQSLLPTKTNNSPSSTPKLTETVTQENLNEYVKKKCVKLSDQEFHQGSGALLGYNLIETTILRYDIKSGKEEVFLSDPQAQYLAIEQSPNRDWLLFRVTYKNVDVKYVVINNKGKIKWSSPVQKCCSDPFMRWLTNDLLIMDKFSEGLFTVNPFTIKSKKLNDTFPDIYVKGNESLFYWTPPYISYSPDLSQVFYPSAYPNQVNPPYTINLFDLQQGRIISKLKIGYGFGIEPFWMGDSSGFVIVYPKYINENETIGYEFYFVSKYGVETQLTQLTKVYPFNFIQVHSIWGNLSPDGKKLLFLLDGGKSISNINEEGFHLLNMVTGDVISFCMKGDTVSSYGEVKINPIWSPDSRYFIASIDAPDNPENSIMVFVDSQTGDAYDVPTGFVPMAWIPDNQ